MQQGVEFVCKSVARMQGGEIFAPKIPSVTITKIAEALGPELDLELIGLRPGEKLHEVLCPKDDWHKTIEFDDHYVIQPAIQFTEEIDFSCNKLGEHGRPVPRGFEYSSESNHHFLTVEEIKAMNRDLATP